MTTSVYVAPLSQAALEAAVRTYETHRKLYSGHFTTSAATDDNGTHLHLRDPQAPAGKKFYGIAVPGPEGVRVTKTGTCPLCHDLPAPTHGHVVRHEQIGTAR